MPDVNDALATTDPRSSVPVKKMGVISALLPQMATLRHSSDEGALEDGGPMADVRREPVPIDLKQTGPRQGEDDDKAALTPTLSTNSPLAATALPLRNPTDLDDTTGTTAGQSALVSHSALVSQSALVSHSATMRLKEPRAIARNDVDEDGEAPARPRTPHPSSSQVRTFRGPKT